MPEGENYKFFSHRSCEFFPCHGGVDPQRFNCLFCYCPLYALGRNCGGNYVYNERGIKDCSACPLPHIPESYEIIVERYDEIMKLVAELDETRAKGDL